MQSIIFFSVFIIIVIELGCASSKPKTVCRNDISNVNENFISADTLSDKEKTWAVTIANQILKNSGIKLPDNSNIKVEKLKDNYIIIYELIKEPIVPSADYIAKVTIDNKGNLIELLVGS